MMGTAPRRSQGHLQSDSLQLRPARFRFHGMMGTPPRRSQGHLQSDSLRLRPPPGHIAALAPDGNAMMAFYREDVFESAGIAVPVTWDDVIEACKEIHYPVRGAGVLRSLIIIPVFISPVAMGLTWRFIFEPASGLANRILDSGLGFEKFSWPQHKDTALSTLMIKAQTMPVALQETIDVYNVPRGSLSAGAVIQLLPIALVVFLLQRHIARGLALGAVK